MSISGETMPAKQSAESVLQAIAEPALIVGTDGRVAFANDATLSRMGPRAKAGHDLSELIPEHETEAGLRAYLFRCSGSRSPLLGKLEFRDTNGQAARFRSYGSLLEPARDSAPALILLRLAEAGDERFSALAQKVRDLNEEIRKRRRTQALLEEALCDRDLLMRELHHRVKNNIQMLASMLYMARREVAGRDAASVLDDASRRLAAVGMVHQLLYSGESLRGIRGDEFVGRVCDAVMQTFDHCGGLSINAEPIEIPNDAAVPLALILNEFVANALKHGLRSDGKPAQVRVALTAGGDGVVELSVEDEGPGFEPEAGAGRRASGLALVRGLARQVGGSLKIERGQHAGARCAIRLWSLAERAGGNPRQ